jgi:hypothetical protein
MYSWLSEPDGAAVGMVVLLSAEMIAKRYYRALYEGTQDALLQDLFSEIRDEKEGHITFRCAFLQNDWTQLTPA